VKTYKPKKTSKVQVIADATDPNIANTITNYVNAILQNRAQEINKTCQPIKYKPKLNCITIRTVLPLCLA
jgi:ABC-2 type transport system permease protein